MSDWAAKVLADVPRHSLDFCDQMEIDKDGVWMHVDDAIAAIDKLGAGDGLVERLLARQVFLEQEWAGTAWRDVFGPDPLTSEAAARIAALTAQVGVLETALTKIDVGEGWAAITARAALKEAGRK